MEEKFRVKQHKNNPPEAQRREIKRIFFARPCASRVWVTLRSHSVNKRSSVGNGTALSLSARS